MRLLTANDLARMWRCEAQTIRLRARRRRIKAHQKVAGQLVWRDDQAELFRPGPNGRAKR